jgi:peptidoglycan/LPS O-acetylase OafA/YrhL
MILSPKLASLLLWSSRAAFAAALLAGTASAVLPSDDTPHILPWDKAEHFVGFYALAALGAFAFPRLKAVWLAAALIALGGGIEVVQGLPMVARDSDVKDWIADTLAVACALGPLVIARWRAGWPRTGPWA